jgi:hypothetical protein
VGEWSFIVSRIYVASSWRNTRQIEVVEALRAVGHEVYDFRNQARVFNWSDIYPNCESWFGAQYVEALRHPAAIQGLASDFEAMHWADTFVMVQPCGRSSSLELGWAIGAGKRTFVLLANKQKPELMLGLAQHLCLTLDELVVTLTGGTQ